MGLDITAYKNIEKVEVIEHEISNEDYTDIEIEVLNNAKTSVFKVYELSYFKEHLGSLEENSYYVYEDDFDMRAGSYSGYGNWRNELARVVCKVHNIEPINVDPYKKHDDNGRDRTFSETIWNLPSDTTIPLYKFINFSDCEGFIGTEYCKIIYQELLDIENNFKEENSNNEYFIRKFDEWLIAFEYGSENGCIQFH